MMKPQDIVVLLALSLPEKRQASYASLAADLGMSPSEAHAAVRRSVAAGLVDAAERRPLAKPLLEFLVHGLRYVFPPERGPLTRGMPTAEAAPVLASRFTGTAEPPPVWPDPEGEVRGIEFVPLYPAVPAAARKEPRLYDLLALVDALRGGRARERAAAEAELRKRRSADEPSAA
jgi:hypothetical protein